ncbi:hypothetical protein M3J09_000070 [Ascochyta lentis]
MSAGIPSEVRHIMLSFLPNSSLKNVRLVNKQWSAAAATILWSDLTLDLVETGHRKLDALLDSESGGVLDSVKKLSISTGQSGLSTTCRGYITELLHDLFIALPRDCLIQLSSKHLTFGRRTAELLLRTQSNLRTLTVSLSEQGGIPKKNLVRGSLDNLQELCISFNGKDGQDYKAFASWLTETPRLQKLKIVGKSRNGLNYFDGWAMPETGILLNLRELELENLHLPTSVNGILGILNPPDLQVLKVTRCHDTRPLLTSLADALKDTTAGSLKTFRYVSADLADSCDSSAGLISAATGLTDVALVTSGGLLLDLSCLQQNGKSLRRLVIVASHKELCYSAKDLELLVTMCPNLQALAVSLGDFNEHINSLQQLEPFRLSKFTETLQAIKTIARLEHLESLTSTHLPLLRGDHSALERKWRHAQVADEVMACLVNNGSKIQRLKFVPWTISEACNIEADDNGHLWPMYAYLRGKLLYNTEQGQSRVKTVGVPVKMTRVLNGVRGTP